MEKKEKSLLLIWLLGTRKMKSEQLFCFFFLEAPNSKCFKLIYLKTDTSKMKRMVIY